MEKEKKPNKLIAEKSPYLLQHAYNPVDWHPWGKEAFDKAKAEQKPIFLSIGYSTCHWCHVMERESFENDSIAALLNRFFVCIKVDREERPDVDRVYMAALQGMGQNGGWPMSMFLTPDLKPFYGGTYFPPESRHGRPGFPDVVTRVHEVWLDQRGSVLQSADAVTRSLEEAAAYSGKRAAVDGRSVDACFEQIRSAYDSRFGGFGGAPKFPRPAVFNFLLRYHYRTGNRTALEMTAHTLNKMSEGGICDHLGGGFHRYSVDAEWRVPHFEKMLYDQAQLVISFLDLYQITGDARFSSVARGVLDYVIRDMTHGSGGFCSAEDADSPLPEDQRRHGEGAFYTWSKKEIVNLLGDVSAEIFCYHYGVEETGNILSDPHNEFAGKNILYAARSLSETAERFRKAEHELADGLAHARKRLFDARCLRPRPHLDDKVLTSWNGLMISAFSRAHQVLGDAKYLRAAARSAEFILRNLYVSAARTLLRRFRDGEARFDGHLEDYAFFAQSLLDLYEASLDLPWLEAAIEITEAQIEVFWDPEQGGFFDTSGKDTSILVRMKEKYDGAEPAGNSIAAMNLLRLAQFLNRDDWRRKAEQTFNLCDEVLKNQPIVMPQMAAAVDFSIGRTKQIVIAGEKEDPGTKALVQEVFSRYIPNKILLLVNRNEGRQKSAAYSPVIQNMPMVNGKATAYVCEDYVCRLPTSDISVLSSLLERKE